jgi:uncharacterized SAM-binding protein YcdF (DUF218 family)
VSTTGARFAGAWWRIIRRLAIAGLASCGAVLLVVLLTPVSEWLVDPLLVRRDTTQTDAIVLLTAWASRDGLLNDPGLRRTVEAAQLFHQHVADVVVVSGRNRSRSAGPTAEVMANLLVDLGVPRTAVSLETESTSTHESAVNIARMARAQDWKSVTVVSDASHMRRALGSFRRQGVAARAGADVRAALRAPWGFYRTWMVERAAHEWIGLLYYWSRGWI